MIEPNAAPHAMRALPMQFTASGSEYFRIWIVNLLLTVVTLGLYLPFAKARRLRYFYANTLVDEQPLAFHGDPWRMFRGHLVVVGFALCYFLSSHLWPEGALLLLVAFLVVWPLLWRSSLIFRMRNTSWRGLRFEFTGSAKGAYKAFLPWLISSLLLVVLLGIFAAVLVPALKTRGVGAPSTATRRVVIGGVVLFYIGMLWALAPPPGSG